MAEKQTADQYNAGSNPHEVISITKVEYDQLQTHGHKLKEAYEDIKNKTIIIEEFQKLLLLGGNIGHGGHSHHPHGNQPANPFLEQVSSVFGNTYQVNTGHTYEGPSRVEVKMEGSYKAKYDDIIKKLKETNK